jgi:hypothetical protein
MAMKINNKYHLGQKVFLVTDSDQLERMVTVIGVRPQQLTYTLACGSESTEHFEEEIADERRVI